MRSVLLPGSTQEPVTKEPLLYSCGTPLQSDFFTSKVSGQRELFALRGVYLIALDSRLLAIDSMASLLA